MTLELAKSNIGRNVCYKPYGLNEFKEYGIITSVSLIYVFVRYGEDVASKATGAEDLELVSEET